MRLISQLLRPRARENPWALYSQALADGGVAADDRAEFEWFGRYAEVEQLLQTTALIAVPDLSRGAYPRAGHPVLDQLVQSSAPFASGDRHAELRSLLDRDMIARMQEASATRAGQIVPRALQRLDDGERVDVFEAVATAVPFEAICDVLSIPGSVRDFVRARLRLISRFLEPVAGPHTIAEAEEAAADLTALLSDRAGLDSVVNAPERTPNRDVVATTIMLMLTAVDTTAALIGTSLALLGRDVAAADRWRNAPGAKVAVEELVRHQSPVQHVTRRAEAHETYFGRSIYPGTMVFLSIAAANRDPAQFANPDILDFERSPNRHLGFGGGIHGCWGSAVAKSTTLLVLKPFEAVFDNLSVEEVAWDRRVFLRTPKRLVLSIQARPDRHTPPFG